MLTASARPQNRPRWECNSPGTISTRCDTPLDTRVHIGLDSTLGLLTLARTDKLSLFVVRACLRECKRHRFWLCTAISGAPGRSLPVVSARQFGLSSRRTALPLKHPEGLFWSTLWVREAGKNGVREGGLSWCSFTGFWLSWTAGASLQWRSGGGLARVRWVSQGSLVGLRYLIRFRGDTGIVMVNAKALRPKFRIFNK